MNPDVLTTAIGAAGVAWLVREIHLIRKRDNARTDARRPAACGSCYTVPCICRLYEPRRP